MPRYSENLSFSNQIGKVFRIAHFKEFKHISAVLRIMCVIVFGFQFSSAFVFGVLISCIKI